jgi:hypothetical protein
MANVMKPPPEPRAPIHPKDASLPGYAQQPRKSYRWVGIVVAIVVLAWILGSVIISLGIGFAVSTYGGQTIATDQYYSAIKDQDYARAYSYLGSDLKGRLGQETFTQTAQQRDLVDGKVIRFAFSNVPKSDPASVTVTVMRAHGTSYAVHLGLRQEGGTWKITAFDRI